MSKNVKRLYEQFQPNHYILNLNPDKESLTFSGSVIIAGKKTGRPSQRLTFHQKGLKITSAHVVRHDKKGDEEVELERINTHKRFDEVRLHAKELLYPGSYTVRLEFSGEITRPMNGLYPCFFKHRGKEKRLIATQFESHHTREAFPCIDEPEAKATFELIVTTPKGETVLSNTPVKSQAFSGKTMTTAFETTPHMSTYLLALVYGELKHKETKTKDGTLIRVFATPDNIEQADFALETAARALEFYEDYFSIKFPLPKCDFVALPDFSAAAMENWGCITFREQALLVDEKHTSIANKQLVAMVIAHELTHQWFGNLVTMRWWTDLWLNEGFATWMSYLATDHLFPEWKMWTQFIVDEQLQAQKLDALENTHPIEVPVHHPDEIIAIFDSISYDKGASTIHMLHDYLGKDAFRTGLQYYLKKHSYNNTDTVDLWDALETASHKPIKKFMQAWTSQPGFPIVKASIEEQTLEIEQEQFYINPVHKPESSQLWPIALGANVDALPELFEKKQQTFTIASQLDHFILNTNHDSFFRTVYNSSHLERLGEQIRRGRLAPLDRLGILSDLIETAKAGRTDTADALHFLTFFIEEDDYAVWDVIAGFIGVLRLVMNDEQLREDMKPFIRALTAKQLKRLGFTRKPDDSHFDRLLRPIILGLAASADEPEVVEKCLTLFKSVRDADDVASDLQSAPLKRSVKRGGDMDPDMRGLVFGTVARKGGESEFKKLLKLHNDSTMGEERVTLSAALTGFRQKALNERALKLISSKDVRLQDTPYWIAYSFTNRFSRPLTWEWLTGNWDWVKANLGSDHAFSFMPIYSARAFSDKDFLKDYERFFESVMEPSLARSFKQGVEMIEWQSAWKERALKETKVFFKSEAEKQK